MAKLETEIILEAISIIRKYPTDKSVLREQLAIIEKVVEGKVR